MTDTIDSWLAALDPENRATVDRLRGLVRAAAPRLSETIKWNAPSFADGDQDRVTLGLERRGGVRLVLHRGAALKAAEGFAFDDPAGLARWPARDRGVMTFVDAAAVAAKAADVEGLVRRWVEATRTET
tara:strand:- start:918 stop:1304 length:387 start_codon:yes stop_codon:yes gene_type:complete